MSTYRVISSDNHVIEPDDLWTSRVDSKFKDRAPQIEHYEDRDLWLSDGHMLMFTGGGAMTGVRFEDPAAVVTDAKSEENRPGSYIPEEHVKDLDIDGVDVSVLYPTVALFLYGVRDTDLLTENIRVYNDYVGEFCNAIPKRLKGIAMLNIDDIGHGVRELERAHKLGFIGAMIPVTPPEGRPYGKAEYDPLWAAAQDLGMPLSLHIGTDRTGPDSEVKDVDNYDATHLSNVDYFVRMTLGSIIFAGIFERFPGLQIGSVEHEVGWAPHFLDRMDYNYAQRAQVFSPYRFKNEAFPSDFFRTNVFVGFQEDPLAIKDRHIIGVDVLQWGSDYPHAESTFPRSRQILEELLAECNEEEKAKIAGGNAARIYHL